jgi:hypothetical protein
VHPHDIANAGIQRAAGKEFLFEGGDGDQGS